MTRPSAHRIEQPEGRQYHIGLAPGEVAPAILLVGDPSRADRVAARFDRVRLTRRQREYVSHTGEVGGREVTVVATGIGCDNTEIAVMELLNCVTPSVLLRVGSCGALQPDVPLGDAVISTGSVRLESTSLAFAREGYPALAHHEVVLALISAAEGKSVPYHVGLTATAPGFYGWQGRSGQPIRTRFPDLPDELAAQGVVNFEMEASTLFVMAALANVRAGAVCAVFANRPQDSFVEGEEKREAEARAITVGLAALDVLDFMDEGGDRPFHLKLS